MSPTDTITLINLLAPLLVFIASFISHRIYASLKPDQQEIVDRVAGMVVPAVEQTLYMFTGEEKRARATEMIMEILRGMGIKNVSGVLVGTAIEASVYSLKNYAIQHHSTIPLQENMI